MNRPKLPVSTIAFVVIMAAALLAGLWHVKPVKDAGAALVTPAGDLPVFELDDAHNLLAQPNFSGESKYTMAPGRGFVLDASKYTIPTSRLPAGVPAPNVIWIRTQDDMYRVPWQPGQTRFEISARTAQTKDHTGMPFRVNSPGEVSVLINYETPHAPMTPGAAQPFWIGTVSIVRP